MKHVQFSKIAAMNMHYQRVSFTSFLDSIENLGISSFELWAGSPHYYHPILNYTSLGRLKAEIHRRNLQVVCLTPEQCVYPFNIAASDPSLRKESQEYFISYLRQASELEIPKLLLTSGWGYYDEDPREAWKRCLDSVALILKTAERYQIVLAFEILQEIESNLVHDLPSLLAMMSQFDSSYFTCCLDTVPICVEGKTLDDYFQVFGNKISHIHLNDGTPAGHLTWGDGSQDLAAHLDTLGKHEYSGAVTLEIGDPRYYQAPEKALLQGLSYIKNLL